MPSLAAVSSTCAASSRVGTMTSALVPSSRVILGTIPPSAAKIGHMYARVFPEPVSARIRTSSPRRMCGIARCCTLVGFLYPVFASLRWVTNACGRPAPSHVLGSAPNTLAFAASLSPAFASAAGTTTPPPSTSGRAALRMSEAQSFGLNSSPSSSSSSLAATSRPSSERSRAPRPPRPPLPPRAAPGALPPRPSLPPRAPLSSVPAAAAAAARSGAEASTGAQSVGWAPRPPPPAAAPTPGRPPRPPRPAPRPPAGAPRVDAFALPTMSARLPAHPRCRPLRSGFMTVRLRGLPFLEGPSWSPSSRPARFITKPSSSPIAPACRPRASR